MSAITNLNGEDLITNSRAVINNNFAALNNDKLETSAIDTDTTLAANSDTKVPSQKAVKAYVDALGPAGFASAFTVETSTATTYDFVVDGSQRVIVFCKGNLDNTGNETVTISLQQEGVTKDIVVSNMGSGGDQMPFSLMYTEIPANGTYTLGLTANSSGGIANIKYIVLKISVV